MRLANKVAIVTGASGGMGQVAVQRFLKEGAKVTATDIVIEEMQDDDVLCVKTDVTSGQAVGDLVKRTIDHFGRVDILVNFAGIAQAATPVEEVSEALWDRIMAINTKSLFLTTRAVVPYMKKQRSGVIVNIASIAAVRPRPGLNAYVASKGAAVALAQALAIELADCQIRVNVINPGPADTQMLGQFAAPGTDIEKAKETIFKQSVPLGELIQPEDIANTLVFLCSDEAKHVTGAVFNIDGGRGI